MLHRFPARSAVLLAILTAASCEPSRSLAPAEPTPPIDAKLTARGEPLVIRTVLDLTETIPAGFFCPDVDVGVRVVGLAIDQIWTAGEFLVDETLWKSEVRADLTFTHPVTGKSITNHQSDASEVIIVDFEFVAFKSSGASLRVSMPGEGLVAYFIGQLQVNYDFSTTPPTVTSEFHGIELVGDLCALIS